MGLLYARLPTAADRRNFAHACHATHGAAAIHAQITTLKLQLDATTPEQAVAAVVHYPARATLKTLILSLDVPLDGGMRASVLPILLALDAAAAASTAVRIRLHSVEHLDLGVRMAGGRMQGAASQEYAPSHPIVRPQWLRHLRTLAAHPALTHTIAVVHWAARNFAAAKLFTLPAPPLRRALTPQAKAQ